MLCVLWFADFCYILNLLMDQTLNLILQIVLV